MKILAVDIGGTAIKAALYDTVAGVLIDPCEVPSRGSDGGEAVVARVLATASRYSGYAAVGVSTAGQVDPERGVITFANANIPGYTGTRLGERLADALGVPAAVGNDAHCAALGEAEAGAARGLRDFVMLTIGTGIGGAAVTDGRLLAGANSQGGQLGHIITHVGGRPCACGGRGCWEQYGSTSALVRSSVQVSPAWKTGRTVLAAVADADPAAVAVVDAWLDEISAGIASLVAIFDPRRVVLGGGTMQDAARIAVIEERVRALVMPPLRQVSVVPAELGNRAALHGAARLALRRTEDEG
jgi:Transcriptional regulator/sugar kinase